MNVKTQNDDENQKKQLELDKLRLEIHQLQRPLTSGSWWLGNSMSSFLGVLIAIVAAFMIWRTGLLDVKRERLVIEKIQLQQGNKQLQQMQSLLQTETATLRSSLGLYREEEAAIDELAQHPGCTITLRPGFKELQIVINSLKQPDFFDISPDQRNVLLKRRIQKAFDAYEDPPADKRLSPMLLALQKLRRLRGLELELVALNQEEMQLTSELSHVENLTFEHVKFPDGFVDLLATLPQLHTLTIRSCKFRDAGAWDRLSGITTLNLRNTLIGESALAEMQNLHDSVKTMDLSDTKIGDAGFEAIRRFVNLEILRLEGHTGVTFKGLKYLQALPNLKLLHLDKKLSSQIPELKNILPSTKIVFVDNAGWW